MSALDGPRRSLDTAQAAFQRVASSTASSWDDDARRSFDAQFAQPLEASVRQYSATLASLDATLDTCRRLLGN